MDETLYGNRPANVSIFGYDGNPEPNKELVAKRTYSGAINERFSRNNAIERFTNPTDLSVYQALTRDLGEYEGQNGEDVLQMDAVTLQQAFMPGAPLDGSSFSNDGSPVSNHDIVFKIRDAVKTRNEYGFLSPAAASIYEARNRGDIAGAAKIAREMGYTNVSGTGLGRWHRRRNGDFTEADFARIRDGMTPEDASRVEELFQQRREAIEANSAARAALDAAAGSALKLTQFTPKGYFDIYRGQLGDGLPGKADVDRTAAVVDSINDELRAIRSNYGQLEDDADLVEQFTQDENKRNAWRMANAIRPRLSAEGQKLLSVAEEMLDEPDSFFVRTGFINREERWKSKVRRLQFQEAFLELPREEQKLLGPVIGMMRFNDQTYIEDLWASVIDPFADSLRGLGVTVKGLLPESAMRFFDYTEEDLVQERLNMVAIEDYIRRPLREDWGMIGDALNVTLGTLGYMATVAVPSAAGGILGSLVGGPAGASAGSAAGAWLGRGARISGFMEDIKADVLRDGGDITDPAFQQFCFWSAVAMDALESLHIKGFKKQPVNTRMLYAMWKESRGDFFRLLRHIGAGYAKETLGEEVPQQGIQQAATSFGTAIDKYNRLSAAGHGFVEGAIEQATDPLLYLGFAPLTITSTGLNAYRYSHGNLSRLVDMEDRIAAGAALNEAASVLENPNVSTAEKLRAARRIGITYGAFFNYAFNKDGSSLRQAMREMGFTLSTEQVAEFRKRGEKIREIKDEETRLAEENALQKDFEKAIQDASNEAVAPLQRAMKATGDNQELKDALLGGHLRTGEEILREDISLGVDGKLEEMVQETNKGRKVSLVNLAGTYVLIEFGRDVSDVNVNDESVGNVDSIVEGYNNWAGTRPADSGVTQITSEQWLALSPEERQMLVDNAGLTEQGNFTATGWRGIDPETGMLVDYDPAKHPNLKKVLTGKMNIREGQSESAAYHEIVHTFARVLKDNAASGNESAAEFLQALTDAFPVTLRDGSQTFDEEKLAIAMERYMVSQKDAKLFIPENRDGLLTRVARFFGFVVRNTDAAEKRAKRFTNSDPKTMQDELVNAVLTGQMSISEAAKRDTANRVEARRKEAEERTAREEAARKAEEERKAREEAERRAEEARKAKEEAAHKAAEARRIKEESARRAEEARREEEALRKAAEESRAAAIEQARLAAEEEERALAEARAAREEAERMAEEERKAREEAERRNEELSREDEAWLNAAAESQREAFGGDDWREAAEAESARRADEARRIEEQMRRAALEAQAEETRRAQAEAARKEQEALEAQAEAARLAEEAARFDNDEEWLRTAEESRIAAEEAHAEAVRAERDALMADEELLAAQREAVSREEEYDEWLSAAEDSQESALDSLLRAQEKEAEAIASKEEETIARKEAEAKRRERRNARRRELRRIRREAEKNITVAEDGKHLSVAGVVVPNFHESLSEAEREAIHQRVRRMLGIDQPERTPLGMSLNLLVAYTAPSEAEYSPAVGRDVVRNRLPREVNISRLNSLERIKAVDMLYELAAPNIQSLHEIAERVAADSVRSDVAFRLPNKEENDLPVKRRIGILNKATRLYGGDLAAVSDVISASVRLNHNDSFGYGVYSTGRIAKEYGASIASIEPFLSKAKPSNGQGVRITLRFENGGLGEILLRGEDSNVWAADSVIASRVDGNGERHEIVAIPNPVFIDDLSRIKHSPEREAYIKQMYWDRPDQYVIPDDAFWAAVGIAPPEVGVLEIDATRYEAFKNHKTNRKELHNAIFLLEHGLEKVTLLSEDRRNAETGKTDKVVDALLHWRKGNESGYALAEFKQVDSSNPNTISHRIQQAANKENSEVITIFFTDFAKGVDYEKVLDAVSERKEKGFFRGKYDLLYFASGNDLLGINSGTASPNEESGSTHHALEPITGPDHAAQENPSISGEAESTTIFPATEEDTVSVKNVPDPAAIPKKAMTASLREAKAQKASGGEEPALVPGTTQETVEMGDLAAKTQNLIGDVPPAAAVFTGLYPNADGEIRRSVSSAMTAVGVRVVEGEASDADKAIPKYFDLPDGTRWSPDNPLTPEMILAGDNPLTLMLRIAGEELPEKEKPTDGERMEIASLMARLVNKAIELGTSPADNNFYAEMVDAIWRWEASTAFKAIKANGDRQYGQSIDVQTICKKTAQLMAAVADWQKRNHRGATIFDMMRLYFSVGVNGFQTPCPFCYVFSRWLTKGMHYESVNVGQLRYAAYLTRPENLSEQPPEVQKYWNGTEQQKVAFWKKELAEARNREKDSNGGDRPAIKKARAELDELRSLFDKIVMARMAKMRAQRGSGALTQAEAAEILGDIEAYRTRYFNAYRIVANANTSAFISKCVLNGNQLNNYKVIPDNILFDYFLTHRIKEEYPIIWKYLNSFVSAAGKAIEDEANNDFGDAISSLSTADPDKNNSLLPCFDKAVMPSSGDSPDTLKAKKELREERIKNFRKEFKNARKRIKVQSIRGAVRAFSWSDWQYDTVLDYLMIAIQIQLLRSPIQSYTKQLEGAEVFGLLGQSTNISLVPSGSGIADATADDKDAVAINVYDADGIPNGVRYVKPVFSNTMGANAEEARALNALHDSVGNITIGINDDHIRAILKHPKYFFMIGYHSSGLARMILRSMRLFMGDKDIDIPYTDYTGIEEEHVILTYDEWLKEYKKKQARNERKKKKSKSNTPATPEEEAKAAEKKAQEDAAKLEEAKKESLYQYTVHPALRYIWEKKNFFERYPSALETDTFLASDPTALSEEQLRYRKLYTKCITKPKAIFENKADLDYVLKDYFLSRTFKLHVGLDENGNILTTIVKDKKTNKRVETIAQNYAGVTSDVTTIYPAQYWDENSTYETADENGNAYLEWCRRMGFAPKYAGIKASGAMDESNRSVGNFIWDKGYWKTLVDVRMYDRAGNYRGNKPINIRRLLEPFGYTDADGNSRTVDYLDKNSIDKRWERKVGGKVVNTVTTPPNRDKAIVERISTAADELAKQIGLDYKKDLDKLVDPAAEGDLNEIFDAFLMDGDTRHSFLGENGAAALDAMEGTTKRMDDLLYVKERLKLGLDTPEKLFKQTGWFMWLDGTWRYEINANDIEVNTEALTGDKIPLSSLITGGKYKKDLFAAYKNAEKINLVDSGNKNSTYYTYEKNDDTGEYERNIHIDFNSLRDNIKTGHMSFKLHHELQHFIQAQEGFNRGGDPKDLPNDRQVTTSVHNKLTNTLSAVNGLGIDSIPRIIYKTLGGESEANLAAWRGIWQETETGLREIFPITYEDFARIQTRPVNEKKRKIVVSLRDSETANVKEAKALYGKLIDIVKFETQKHHSIAGTAINPSSNLGLATALVARDRALGYDRPDESYANVMSALGVIGDNSDLTMNDIRTYADDLLNALGDMAQVAAEKSLYGLAKEADIRLVDQLVGRMVAGMGKESMRIGGRAEKAFARAMSHYLKYEMGKDAQDLADETGIDIAELLMQLPVKQVERKSGARKKPKDKLAQALQDGQEPEREYTEEEQADLRSRAERLETDILARRERILARLQEWREMERERMERLAGKQARLQADRDSLDRVKEEEAEEFGEEQTPGNFPITDEDARSTPDYKSFINALREEGIDVRDVTELGVFLQIWVEDFCGGEIESNANPERFIKYKRTMRQVLRYTANALIDGDEPDGGKAIRRIERCISDIELAQTMVDVQKSVRASLARIQQAKDRFTRDELVKQLRKEIKLRAIKGKEFDALQKDLKRKMRGSEEKKARFVWRILDWSEGEIDRAKQALWEVISGRKDAYEREAGEELSLPTLSETDAEVHEAVVRLNLLEQFGGLRRRTVAEVRARGREILHWLDVSGREHDERWAQWMAGNDALAAKVQELSKRKDTLAPSESMLNRFTNQMVATIRQRLEGLFVGANREQAKAVIEEIMNIISGGSQELAVLKVRFNREHQAMLESAVEGTGKTVIELLKELDDTCPRELNELLITNEQHNTMTWGQVMQLYVSLCQTQSYGSNIVLHGRTGQKELIESYLTDRPELLRLVMGMRSLYTKRRAELSAMMETVCGMPMYSPDPLYMPVKMYNGAREGFDSQVNVWNPFGKWASPRIKNANDFDLSASLAQMFTSRSNESARSLAWGVRGMQLRSVFGRKETQEVLRNNHTKEDVTAFMEQLTDTVSDGYRTAPLRFFGEVATGIGNFSTYTSLSWNVCSMLKQVAALPAWAAVLDEGTGILGEMVRNMMSFDIDSAKELMDTDGFIARYGSTGVKEMFLDAFNDRTKNGLSRFYRAGMNILQMGDLAASILIGASLYKAKKAQYIRQGMEEDEAKNRASTLVWAFVEESQQSSRPENMNDWMRRHGLLARNIVKFATSPLLQLSHEVHAARMMNQCRAEGNEEDSKRWRRRLVNQILCNHVVMPALMMLIAEVFNAALGDEPPDEEEWVAELLLTMLIGPFGRVFIIGLMLEESGKAILKTLGLKPPRYNNSATPTNAMITRLGSTIGNLGGDVIDEDWASVRDDFLDSIAAISQPARYAVKAGRNMADYDKSAERQKRKRLIKKRREEAAQAERN